MIKHVLKIVLISFFCLPMSAIAENVPFEAGKDYEILTPSKTINEAALPKNKVQVVEFFSYGCPACYNIDSAVDDWLATKPAFINFSRVPIIFHSEWTILAKAYYTAKALHALPKIHPALFAAIHKEYRSFNNEKDVEELFVQQGVKKTAFESAFEFSPEIEAQIKKSYDLMDAYKIYTIPTFVINGKYKTGPGMVSGDAQKLFKLVDFLAGKERQGS